MTYSPPPNSTETAAGRAPRPRRWDPVVKVTHWSIVAAILANALITEEGSGIHIWIGYALAGVLAMRLLWGFIGPAEARFSAFPPSPRRALVHVREIRAGKKDVHASHNPLGALMVYAIWSMLGLIIASGIAMAGPPPTTSLNRTEVHAVDVRHVEIKSSLDDEDERYEDAEDEEGVWGEVHEIAVNILYVLILLHVAGVAFETRRSGRQILLAMLPARG